MGFGHEFVFSYKKTKRKKGKNKLLYCGFVLESQIRKIKVKKNKSIDKKSEMFQVLRGCLSRHGTGFIELFNLWWCVEIKKVLRSWGFGESFRLDVKDVRTFFPLKVSIWSIH